MVGNPNSGKTTLFNSLTGSRQKVGNYAGVTVEKVSGTLTLPSGPVECIDVPGMYSMVPVSEDERVAADVVKGDADMGRPPDLLVCVIDVTNLERNLYLFSQLAEVGLPVLVALTMVDRLKSSGKAVDLIALANRLGVDVVPVVGHKDQGIQDLISAIDSNLKSPKTPLIPSFRVEGPAVLALRDRLSRLGVDESTSELHDLLQNPQSDLWQYTANFPELQEDLELAVDELAKQDPDDTVTQRYAWAARIQSETIRIERPVRQLTTTDRIDLVLTHRVFGLAVFVALMFLVFQSIYTFAQPVMDVIDRGFSGLADLVGKPLSPIPVLKSLVVDGIIHGVGSMLVFLPQILILFFFIAVLEGTGYLARAAFLMDRLLGWCGLNGRAFIPLLSSFACAIPGIMSARVMPDPKSRLATILVAPLMSCSARLPIYLLLIGAFIQPRYGAFWAAFTLFAMHLLGLVVAIPLVWIFNRRLIRGKRLPFMLELPPYQMPKWRDVWLSMYNRGRIFVKTAGTIIVVMSIAIWALGYFPQLTPEQKAQVRQSVVMNDAKASKAEIDRVLQEKQLAGSVLGRFGKTIEPVFIPAGFDWRITTSILAAFPARETVVPSLGIIFSLGGDVDSSTRTLQISLADAKWPDGRPLFTPWTAVGLMVFFALCAQCFSTLATVARETNSWKWPAFMFCYMTALAYIFAVGIQQLSRLF